MSPLKHPVLPADTRIMDQKRYEAAFEPFFEAHTAPELMDAVEAEDLRAWRHELEICYRQWQVPMRKLSAMERLALSFSQLFATFSEQHTSTHLDDTDLLTAVHQIQGRILRNFRAIRLLTMHGYNGEATALLRGMYELLVTARFLSEANEGDTATRYLRHQIIQVSKMAGAAQTMEKESQWLASNFTDDQVDEYRAIANQVAQTYGGKEFKTDNGWATEELWPAADRPEHVPSDHTHACGCTPRPPKKYKADFVDIEARVNLKEYRPLYRIMSWEVHPASVGNHLAAEDENPNVINPFGRPERVGHSLGLAAWFLREAVRTQFNVIVALHPKKGAGLLLSVGKIMYTLDRLAFEVRDSCMDTKSDMQTES